MMKSLPAAVLLAAVTIPFTAGAQSRPDFSGTWTMDPVRSESTRQGEPVKPVSVVIAQSAAEIRIETTRGDQTEKIVYPLGQSHGVPPGNSTLQPEAYWDGDTLVTETQRQVQGYAVTVKETRALAPGGAEMIMETIVIVQHGYTMPGVKNYGTARDVFRRTTP
jgi:hypothetical protein